MGAAMPTAPIPGLSQIRLGAQSSLLERLQYRSAEDPAPVPQALLQTYIAYARQHVQPVLSEPARQVGPSHRAPLQSICHAHAFYRTRPMPPHLQHGCKARACIYSLPCSTSGAGRELYKQRRQSSWAATPCGQPPPALHMQLLRSFFLELRGKQGAVEGMSVTLRQLESLLRLCEARARMRLSDTITLVRAAAAGQHLIAGILRKSLLVLQPELPRAD